jgi:hypothetical protein
MASVIKLEEGGKSSPVTEVATLSRASTFEQTSEALKELEEAKFLELVNHVVKRSSNYLSIPEFFQAETYFCAQKCTSNESAGVSEEKDLSSEELSNKSTEKATIERDQQSLELEEKALDEGSV